MLVLDKLGFFTKEFEIAKTTKRQIRQTVDSQTGETMEKSFDIFEPSLNRLGILCKGRFGQLEIYCSPSRLSTDGVHNVKPINANEYEAQLQKLETVLKEAGVSLNIWDSRVCRFDQAVDCIIPRPYSVYLNEFRLLGFPCRKEKQVGTTFYYGNQQETLVFYDKGIECRKKGFIIPEDYRGKNLLRYEHRIYNGRKFRTITGIEKVSEIIKVLPLLRSHFKKQLFKMFNHG